MTNILETLGGRKTAKLEGGKSTQQFEAVVPETTTASAFVPEGTRVTADATREATFARRDDEEDITNQKLGGTRFIVWPLDFIGQVGYSIGRAIDLPVQIASERYRNDKTGDTRFAIELTFATSLGLAINVTGIPLVIGVVRGGIAVLTRLVLGRNYFARARDLDFFN